MDFSPLWRRFARNRARMLARTSPAGLQTEQLKKLVALARETRIGRDHAFGRIRTIADYQSAVPLRTCDEFMADYWREGFPHLVDVTWPGKIPLFATTSGTTSGAIKRVPITAQAVASFRRATLESYVWHLVRVPASKVLAGRSFVFGAPTSLSPLAPDVHEGFITGITRARMPWYLRVHAFPPAKISDIPEFGDRADAIAAVARGFDVRAIAGMPSWLLVLFERLAGRLGVEPKLRHIWPALGLVVHGGISLAPYASALDEWLEGLDVDQREVYMASEGFLAIADREPGEGLRLNLDMGMFFEFVPAEEVGSPNPRRFWIGNVEADVDYAVILTTCAGLWSYVLGDIVRFVDTLTPRVLVRGRVGQGLSAFGEHLLLREIEAAMSDASRSLGVVASEYTVAAVIPARWKAPGHHRYYLEGAAPADYDLGGRLAARLDHALAHLNHRYEDNRRGGVVIGAPEVCFVAAGTFGAWMKRHNRLGGQYKVPRILTDSALHADLRGHLENAVVRPPPEPALPNAVYG
jgi:hypothetical protein